MPYFSLEASSTSLSSEPADSVYRTSGYALPTTATSASKTLPTVRVSNLGNWPIFVVKGRMYLGGREATRSFTLTAKMPGQTLVSSASFNITSQTAAISTGWKTINAKYSAASKASGATFGFTASGNYYYGRYSGGVGGATDLPYMWGLYEYYQVPTAPTLGSTGLTVSGSSITASWSAPSDWGGDSTRKYKLQYSTSSTFASGVTTIPDLTTTSKQVTGLANGTYYFRVYAYNSIHDNFSNNPMSVASTTRNATVNVISTYTTSINIDGVVYNETVNVGSSISLPSIEKTGYTALGWYSLPSGGTFLASATNGVYTPTSSGTTIYAQWRVNTLTISYNKNATDATGTVSNSSYSYPNTSTIVNSNNFSRPGYIFAGWGTASSSTTASYQPGDTYYQSLSTGGSKTVTLYAIWTQDLPVFTDFTITATGTLNKNVNTNPDRTVFAIPVQAYSILYSGSGLNPTSWLSINSSGQLSGVPTVIGTYTFKIRANNGGTSNTDTDEISFVVKPGGKKLDVDTGQYIQLVKAQRNTGTNTWTNLTTMKRWNGSIWENIY